MKEDSEIITEMYQRIGEFYNSPRVIRQRNKIVENYQLRDGSQWDVDEYKRRLSRSKANESPPILTINLSAPVVRMIAGHSIENKDKIMFNSRNTNRLQGATDVVTDTVEYFMLIVTGKHAYHRCG